MGDVDSPRSCIAFLLPMSSPVHRERRRWEERHKKHQECWDSNSGGIDRHHATTRKGAAPPKFFAIISALL